MRAGACKKTNFFVWSAQQSNIRVVMTDGGALRGETDDRIREHLCS
jgi:hypothetical protein